MIEATRLKNGSTFKMEGKPYKVIKYFHQKIGRGGATVKLSLRNLETGGLEDKTMNSSAKVEEITTRKITLQLLFSDNETATCMDPTTYEQIEVPKSLIEDELAFVKEGENVDVLFWEERPLSIEIPTKVTMKIIDTAPGAKGNSATNVFKSATIENGLTVKVPLFVNKGELVRIDTRTKEYVERAKNS